MMISEKRDRMRVAERALDLITGEYKAEEATRRIRTSRGRGDRMSDEQSKPVDVQRWTSQVTRNWLMERMTDEAALVEMTIDRDLWRDDHTVQAPQEGLAELEAQSADRLKTIGRLAQELFDTRKERDALKRAHGVTE
jgi:hypothetical protein